MRGSSSSFFDGLSDDDLARILSRCDRRRFPVGATVIADGDTLDEIFVIEAGVADVFVADRDGAEHRVNRSGPQSTLGEMSFLTGQPASATVRASTELDVVVLSHDDFRRVADAFPVIYRNVSAIVSERLGRMMRRTLHDDPGRATVLLDCGAPPLLGYALACSVAWHTRGATLLIVLTDEPPAALAAFAHASGSALGAVPTPERRARLMVTTPEGAFGPDVLADTVRDLRSRFAHVLVQVTAERRWPELDAGVVRLCGPGEPPSGDASAWRLTLRGWTDAGNTVRPNAAGVLSMPALGPDEEHALAAGLLPNTGTAGRAVGWAARDLGRLKVGLALGGGSVRGYAHLGVLRALDRAGLTLDYLAGTSIGAAVAALAATGYKLDAAADLMDEIGGAAFRPTVPTTSLLSSAGLRAGLRKLAGDLRFEDVAMPLAVTAADIVTRREVVFRSGPLWQAVLASMSIPGIYPPLRIGNQLLVDGGVLNPVPTGTVAAMGADVLIGVKLVFLPGPAIATGFTKTPRMLDVMTTTMEMMQAYIIADQAQAATIVIEPAFTDAGGWGLRHFSRGRRFIADGEAAVEDALPRIAAALPWLRD